MTDLTKIAPLNNVMLITEMVDKVVNRPAHLPGMAVLYGPSGFGKTFSAQFAANQYKAFYLEVGAFWTVKRFCDALLQETGPMIRGAIPDKIDAIVERLAMTNRPLIIDEFDHMDTDKKIELVRYLHDQTGAAIILIGEELLPNKLKRWERFHNRISQWVGAQPASINDTRLLAGKYCPELSISEDVLKVLTEASGHRARRICTNLEQVREAAKRLGLTEFGMSDIDFSWFTGASPAGRRF